MKHVSFVVVLLIGWALSAPVWSDDAKTEASTIQKNLDLVFWESVKDSDDPDMYQAYLVTFPEGTFVSLANIKLKGLEKTPVKKQESAKEAESKGLVAEIARWKVVKDSDDPDMYRAYLEEFPDGRFVSLAMIQLKKLVSKSSTTSQEPTVVKNSKAEPEVGIESSTEVDFEPKSKTASSLKKKSGDTCPDGKIQTFKGCIDIVVAEDEAEKAQKDAEARAEYEARAIAEAAIQQLETEVTSKDGRPAVKDGRPETKEGRMKVMKKDLESIQKELRERDKKSGGGYTSSCAAAQAYELAMKDIAERLTREVQAIGYPQVKSTHWSLYSKMLTASALWIKSRTTTKQFCN